MIAALTCPPFQLGVLLGNRQFQAEMQALFATQGKRGDLVVVDPAHKPAVPERSPRPKIIVAGV